METQFVRPSEAFAQRLRETRKRRPLTQAKLAQRMTEGGRPLSKLALLRIESGKRGISLDEALGLAQCLAAAPANLLAPPDDTYLGLTDNVGVAGGALRNWLITGDATLAWPATPGEDDRVNLDEILQRSLSGYAVALVDAQEARDKEGIRAMFDAMVTALDRHRAALAAIDSGEEVRGPGINRVTREVKP